MVTNGMGVGMSQPDGEEGWWKPQVMEELGSRLTWEAGDKDYGMEGKGEEGK